MAAPSCPKSWYRRSSNSSGLLDAQEDAAFQASWRVSQYAGRPPPLTRCRNLGSERVRIYLKREDLLHGGAHKTNQVLGQALLARRMGKRRLIAETGAGQHGVATALAGALFGFETRIYMGARDVARQQLNVFRMRLMGAEVIPVTSGGQGLKDAINEALRDWTASFADTHYLLGTVAGPHPFPTVVREYQRVIGREARAQVLAEEGGCRRRHRLRRRRLQCDRPVRGLYRRCGGKADRVEAAGKGWPARAWRDLVARPAGRVARRRNLCVQDADGQIAESWSSRPAWIIPRSGPSTPSSRTAAAPNMWE